MNEEVKIAKNALDGLIKKSRVHLYKPIQIAEILHHHRVNESKRINLLELEEYRIKSKQWRDDICKDLLGRTCSSSAKFQDDLFNENAIPPKILKTLGDENVRTHGAVEAYIYSEFVNKHLQLAQALDYCNKATIVTFDVSHFIGLFWAQPGLKRSLDKVYEIVVYALFSAITDSLRLQVEVSVSPDGYEVIKEFEDFTKQVMCIDFVNKKYTQGAKIYRVGVTNAADRGLDMYSSWGVAIQIKHLSLDEELAENIVNGISSDRIVIVCKDAEEKIIISLLTQIGWKSRIQSIITEKNLINWYEKALRGNFAHLVGEKLLSNLRNEILEEFPMIDDLPIVLKNRKYNEIRNPDWTKY